MTTTRPGLWPLHNQLETNIVLPENSLYYFSGYPIGLPVPSGDHNGKLTRGGKWHKYLDFNSLRNEDWLNLTGTQVLSATTLSYTVGASVLSGGAAVLTSGTLLLNGTRFQTDAALLNPVGGTVTGSPLLFTAALTPGRIWVYVSDEGVMRYESVAAGVADSPGATEQALVGVDIDALGNVTDGAVLPITQPYGSNELDVVIPITIGDLTVTSALLVSGTADFTGVTQVDAAFSVINQNPATLSGNTVIGTASGGDFLTCHATAQFNENVSIAKNTTLGTTSANTHVINSTIIAPVTIVCASGTTPGVKATGAVASATSHGGDFYGGHPDASGCKGTTSTGDGVHGIALDAAGVAVRGTALEGHAGYFTGDTTSPTYAALRVVPQDADAASPGAGDLYINSARALGKLRVYPTLAWESVHSSVKGHFKRWTSTPASGTETAGAGNELAGVTTPIAEEVGDVLITATGSLTCPSDNLLVLITIYDTTSNSDVATTYWRAPTGSPNRTGPFVIQGIRTLPSTVPRTFVIKFGSASDIDYEDVIITVDGVA